MSSKTIGKNVLKNKFILDNQLDWAQNKVFNIENSTHLDYVLLVKWWKQTIDINVTGDACEFDLRVLFLWIQGAKISSTIKVVISGSNCKVNFYTVALLSEGSDLNFDGGIIIDKWVHNSHWELLEENILLWEDVKIKTLPLLDVHSDDIKASHAARIHRLDKEKLFYMQSKWISNKDARWLCIAWYINKIFEKMEDTEEKQNLLQTLYNQNY